MSDVPTAFRHLRHYVQCHAGVTIGQDEQNAIKARMTASQPTPHSSGAGPHEFGILDMPNEVLDNIVDYLKPADAIALSLSCREMTLNLNYNKRDIQIFRDGLINDRDDACAMLHEQQYEATGLTDRDVLLKHERLESEQPASNADQLYCDACVSTHPSMYFESTQQRAAPSTRICLAAQALLYVCPAKSLSFCQLRRLRKNCLLFGLDGFGCASVDCEDDSLPNSMIASKYDTSGLDLVFYEDYNLFFYKPGEPVRRIPRSVTGTLNRRICLHRTLGSIEVLGSFTGLGKEVRSGKCGRGFCSACRTRWTMQVGPYELADGSMPVELRVRRTLGQLQTPWSKDLLTMVDGGEDLLELLPEDNHEQSPKRQRLR